MKNQNWKYLVLLVLVLLAIGAWYYWDKLKELAAAIKQTSSSSSDSGSSSSGSQTIAENTTPGEVRNKIYQYGNAAMVFEDRDPSTYKTLTAFSGKLHSGSAFK